MAGTALVDFHPNIYHSAIIYFLFFYFFFGGGCEDSLGILREASAVKVNDDPIGRHFCFRP